MTRILFILLAFLLITSVVFSACSTSGGPSKSDIEKFVQQHHEKFEQRHTDLGPFNCMFHSVDDIQMGMPSTVAIPQVGEVIVWPAKFNLTCQGDESYRWELWLYKDAYGEWALFLAMPLGESSASAPTPTSAPTTTPAPTPTPTPPLTPTPTPMLGITSTPTPSTTTTQTTAPQNENSKPNCIQAQVYRVIDGDTIEVSMNGYLYTVRYIGIDTPETVHPSKPVECFGIEASTLTSVRTPTIRI